MRVARSAAVFFFLTSLLTPLFAQNVPKQTGQPEPGSATVPILIDHNRVIIDVDVLLADDSTTRVHAWVDNGDPDLVASWRIAKRMGLTMSCVGGTCSAPSRLFQIQIGGLKIPLANLSSNLRLKPEGAESIAFPGMSAEIKIPSTVLRNYDVLIDFPNHEFTIAQPGTLKFKGVRTKVIVNAENGLIQVPSQIEKKKYNLALDLGSSISFLTEEVFEKLAADHADWPRMNGAVGPANMWGSPEELKQKLMRVDRLQYGPSFLTGVPMASLSAAATTLFEKRAGVPTAGLLGAEALLNYRIGIDYAHSTVYFDIGRLFTFPDFDVIGVILRPEDDGRFTILGVADYGGKPSVPEGQSGVQPGDHLIAVDGIPVAGSTLGQVCSMLAGLPGKERRLTIERNGKQFDVVAPVQHFLAETEEGEASKEKSRQN